MGKPYLVATRTLLGAMAISLGCTLLAQAGGSPITGIAIRTVTLADPAKETAKIYDVAIRGRLTNTIADSDIMCDEALFLLVGNGRTYRAQETDGGGCDSGEVVKGTSTDFAIDFAVRQPGKYTLSYHDFGGSKRYLYQITVK